MLSSRPITYALISSSCNNKIMRIGRRRYCYRKSLTATTIVSSPSRYLLIRCISDSSNTNTNNPKPSLSSNSHTTGVEKNKLGSSSSSSNSDKDSIGSNNKNNENGGTLVSAAEKETTTTTTAASASATTSNDKSLVDHNRTKSETVDSRNNDSVKVSSSTVTDSKKTTTAEGRTSTVAATKEEELSSPSSSSSIRNFFQYCQNVIEETSGLSDIIQLKQDVQDASTKFDIATNQVEKYRHNVLKAQKEHDVAHKKHVNLLMRREEWDDIDATNFIAVTSKEVTTRQDLLDAQTKLKEAENDAMKYQIYYMDKMRQRYHEEQIFQDKWRLIGTYGTWCLIGINTLVFIIGQYRMNLREIQRMDHMKEQLLLLHQDYQQQQLQSQSQQTNDKNNQNVQYAAVVAGNSHNNPVEQDGVVEKHNKDDDDDVDDVVANKSSIVTTAKLLLQQQHTTTWKGITIHAPSMVLGGVASVSCVIFVSLLRGNHK